MFKIVKDRRAWWPVKWKGVTEDGRPVDNQIEMRFRILKVDDFVRLQEEVLKIQRIAPPDEGADDMSLAGEFARAVERFADNWRGVGGENGEPLTWSTENLTLLMNEPHLFDATIAAYRLCLAGGEERRLGN